MKNFEETVHEFYSILSQHQFMEAVATFYDENIISTDNNNEPVKGLENLRQGVEKFINNTAIEKIQLLSTIIDSNLSVDHWHYIFTHKTFGKLDYKQLSVKRWKYGKIIQENHFYNLST